MASDLAWPEKSLAQLGAHVTSGSRGWAKYYSDHGDLFVRITNLRRTSTRIDLDSPRYVQVDPDDAEARRTRLRPGDILISITADIGIIGLVDETLPDPAYINQHIARVRVDPKLADSRFISYFLASWAPQRRFIGATDQGAKAGMNLTAVANLTAAVPPLAEQAAIADALDTAVAQIEALERLIAKQRDIKQGMMQELLSGRSRITGSTETWPEVSLLDLVTIRRGQVDPRRPEFRDLPLIAPDHVESGTGRLLAVKSAADQSAISGKYLVEPGDVIYSKIRPYLRKVHLARFRALCSADMYPLQPKRNVDSRFILNALLSEKFTNFAVSASMRSGIPKINRVELAAYQLGAPSGEEQRAIGRALQDADALIDSLERRLAVARALKEGMMQELLTGRTRLPAEATS
ncbi:restriction endonuclease subunit S [Streptomyces rubrolavendulae]|uniref:EcoKI restriction-modification system protein HsdS n=1 Tax=Streptomyces rubrolavendulae TaxID=285473 RepID=A0A1D8G0G4_9ACTN|nr:restriction endonuclease subunit S [Streptomyces rubrolavendulae]AOT58939.1 EcoKI restriction-modification system protein HsdS [Streptomyces rubrolavendulae]